MPLIGVAIVGYCAGYDSPGSVAGFVLTWAIFIYPIAFGGAFCAHCLLSALKLNGMWPYVVLGFLAGAGLAGVWFGDPGGLRLGLGFGFAGGTLGAATGLTFWSLAFQKSPRKIVQRRDRAT